ncbi:hypothetical protein C1X65_16635 [Pseudomonas sp. FW305-70]|nr:hypothetical protein C1X65_16635 [Pseudomonas sp. FW305-70]
MNSSLQRISSTPPIKGDCGSSQVSRFHNDAVICDAAKNEYACPVGGALIWRFSSTGKGM